MNDPTPPDAPAGFVTVTRERFYEFMNPRHVHPTFRGGYRTSEHRMEWIEQRTREVLGRSVPYGADGLESHYKPFTAYQLADRQRRNPEDEA